VAAADKRPSVAVTNPGGNAAALSCALRRPYWMPHVLLPHVVAVVLGLLLFAGAVADVSGLDRLQP
jgi:hypothetical protein